MTSVSVQTGSAGNATGNGTQVIGRTLAVLQLFVERRTDLGISEIAESLDLSPSTVHRIVRALVEKGYLAQKERNDRYYLGRSAVLLGQAAGQGLGLHLAQEVIERLRDETGESVNLGVRDGDEMVVVISAESRHPLRFSQSPGSRLPVYATAMGKAILSQTVTYGADLDASAFAFRPLTSNTITSVPELRKEMAAIHRRGYSIDNEEAIAGVRCVAVSITSPSGRPIAAMGVQGPAVRMSRSRIKRHAALLSEAAEEISHLLPPEQQL